MNDKVTRYPLAWPTGWKRNPLGGSKYTPFKSGKAHYKGKVTVNDAITRLEAELGRLGATDAVLSTNLRTGLRGDPLSGQPEPADRGAAVYFKLKGQDRVLACDTYTTVAGNVAAIANHIDALRRIERYGVGTLEQVFAGYDALPPPSDDNRPPWRQVFGIHPTATISPADVNLVYRARAKQVANDERALCILNLAREAAMRELGAS
jgi:hypothetical protein